MTLKILFSLILSESMILLLQPLIFELNDFLTASFHEKDNHTPEENELIILRKENQKLRMDNASFFTFLISLSLLQLVTRGLITKVSDLLSLRK